MRDEIMIGAAIVLTIGFGALLLKPAWWRTIPLLGVAFGLLALVDVSMGRPIPENLSLAAPSGRMLGFTAEAGRAIYVWVRPLHGNRPVAVQLPWSDTTADELAAASAKRCQGGSVMLTFSRTWGDDPPLTVTEVDQPQPTPKQ